MSLITGFFGALGSVGNIAGDIGGFISFIIGLVTGNKTAWGELGFWFYTTLLGGVSGSYQTCSQVKYAAGPNCVPGLLKVLTGNLTGITPTGAYLSMYNVSVGAGLAVAAASAATRTVRIVMDVRSSSIALFTDVLLRFGIVVLGIEAGYNFLMFFVNQFQNVAAAALSALFGTIGPGGFATWLLSTIVGVVVGSLNPIDLPMDIIGVILLLIALCCLLYDIGLMLFRIVMLGFAFALAPLCIATAVFDTRNKFFSWWLDLFVACLTIPLVMAFGLGITAKLVTSTSPILNALAIGVVLQLIILISGTVMIGKLVHGLTWKNFSHGGVRGALEGAVAATMVAPRALLTADALSGGKISSTKAGGRMVSAAQKMYAQSAGMGGPIGAKGGGGEGGLGLGQGANDFMAAALGSRPELAGLVNELTPGMSGSQAERGAAAWKNMQAQHPAMASAFANSMMGDYFAGNSPAGSRAGSGPVSPQPRDYSSDRGPSPDVQSARSAANEARQSAAEATGAAGQSKGYSDSARTALPPLQWEKPPTGGSSNAA